MLTPLMTPWKANLPSGIFWNEPAGIVTEKGPICRVTSSVRGLIPLLFAPRVKDSFRSKPGGGPAAISSLAKDEANGDTGQLRLLGEKVIGIVFPPTSVAEPEKLNAPFRGPNGFVSVVLKVPLEEAVKGMKPAMPNPKPVVVAIIV